MRRAGTTTRGFTLVEMMIVVAIIGLLAALATTAVMYGTGRARTNNATFELVSFVSVGQMRAMSSRTPHFLVVWEDGDELGAYLLERGEPPFADPLPDWAVVDPRDDTAVGGNRVLTVPISARGGVAPAAFSELITKGFPSTLSAPYATHRLQAPGGSRLLDACSFCIPSGSGGAVGVLRFNSDGTVEKVTPTLSPEIGPSLAFSVASENPDEDTFARVIAIAVPSGSVKVFR